ncbi:MAG: hypothetical protein ACRDVE_21085 [Actinocrinis sp.]
MSLEIEFEYEDTGDGVWSAPVGPGPLRGRRRGGLPGGSGPTGVRAMFLYAAVALTALAVGAASASGFLRGRQAAQDRSIVQLHLAPLNPLDITPLPPPDYSAQALLTAWTNAYDRPVELSVVNDGPAPVTVLAGALNAPQLPDRAPLTPAGGDKATAPGGSIVLSGRAHFVCGDFASVNRAATTADLTIRTTDGRTRAERLIIDRFSEISEAAVCGQMQPPFVVRSVRFGPVPPGRPGLFTVAVTATNRAPFPLRMRLPQSAVDAWTSVGGLVVSAPRDTIIPPHGTGTITLTAAVQNCSSAQQAGQGDYGLDALAFSDARDGADSPLARVSDAALNLVDLPALMAFCYPPRN